MEMNWFKLDCPEKDIERKGIGELEIHFKNSDHIKCAIIESDEVEKKTIKEKKFENVKFKNIRFKNTTFTKCKFIRCLFIGCSFERVEFHSTEIIDCNMYKCSFNELYLDPKYIKISKKYYKKYSNIVIEMYKKLYENYELMGQYHFKSIADFMFNKTYIYQLNYYYNKGRIGFLEFVAGYTGNILYRITLGYGWRISRFIISMILIILTFTIINISFLCKDIGLGFMKGVFVTAEIMSASNLRSCNSNNSIFIVGELLVGFAVFAIFTSLVTRKILK